MTYVNTHRSLPMRSRRLLVGNIHVLFNPNRGDIKLGQVFAPLFIDKEGQVLAEWFQFVFGIFRVCGTPTRLCFLYLFYAPMCVCFVLFCLFFSFSPHFYGKVHYLWIVYLNWGLWCQDIPLHQLTGKY